MMSENTTQNIFRFLQLRGAITDSNTNDLVLNDQTPLAKQLIAAKDNERSVLAEEFLQKSDFSDVSESDHSKRLLSKVTETIAKNGSVKDLGETNISNQELVRIRDRASDFLLASVLARSSSINPKAETLFKATSALLDPNAMSISLAKYYAKAISLPKSLHMSKTIPKITSKELKNESIPAKDQGISAKEIYQAIMELMSLVRPKFLRMPPQGVLSLNDEAMNSLSANAKKVLKSLNLEPDKYPLDETVQILESQLYREIRRPSIVTSVVFKPSDSEEERPYIKDVGVADLLVVKQHLTAYERVDIAHVENILAGEKKTRTIRQLERTEEIFTTEREVTQEKKTELETAERFELNRELLKL
jgi:hypothetical protein